MIHIILIEPEIPPNTGNIIRLCANSGARLHLVGPLGFRTDDRSLRRAGLDYHEFANISVHENWGVCRDQLASSCCDLSRFLFTTRGQTRYDTVDYPEDVALVFGSETRGVRQEIHEDFPEPHRLRLPMLPGQRSMNLSNVVAIALFETWRQHGFGEI